MGKYTKEAVQKLVGEAGFDWLTPVDNFNNKVDLDLKCSKCSGVFRRSLYNWLHKGRRDCPLCKGRRSPTADLASLYSLFCLNRDDGVDYQMLENYSLDKAGRRCYKFIHKVCGRSFLGSREFFDGRYGCPLCYQDRVKGSRDARSADRERLSALAVDRKARLEAKALSLGVEILSVSKGRYARVSYQCPHGMVSSAYVSDFYSDKLRFCCKEAYLHGVSKGELEIRDFLAAKGVRVVSNDRSLLKGQEVDLWLPDYGIGIEYDGLCCHCESSVVGGGKDRLYHLSKTERMEANGYRLIHVFDSEWYGCQDVVKSMLLSRLGLLPERRYARKLVLNSVSSRFAFDFYEANHCQGGMYSKYNYGLFDEQGCAACMSFSRHPKYEYELSRYATVPYVAVVGGFSKLISHFESLTGCKSLMSFVNRRYSRLDDNAYCRNGFLLERVTRPNYWYTKDYQKIEARHNYRKSALIGKMGLSFDPSLSEWEVMKSQGYDRIWDCGSGVFLKTFSLPF